MSAFGAFTVARAGTKWVLNSSGVLSEVAANVPAFEFNADGTYRGLLVEPAGTNLALRSQEFDNAYWTKTRLNTTGTPAWVDVAVAPDGTTTAEKMIANTDNNTHAIVRSITISTATKYTFSVFAKAGEYDFIGMLGSNPGQGKFFDLANGTVLGDFIATPDSATIEDYGSGWYRCSITTTSTSTTTQFQLYPSDSGTTATFTGDDTSGIFIWGAQLETGSVATSYIPTVASTANRVADSVTLTGASSLIGQTEGTLYVEVTTRLTGGAVGKIIAECRTDGNNRFRIFKSPTDAFQTIVTTGGVDQASIASSTNQSGVFKVALAYKENDFAFYVNGVQVGTDVLGTVPATNRIDIGSTGAGGNQFTDNIRSLALFPSRLSDAQAIALTTL